MQRSAPVDNEVCEKRYARRNAVVLVQSTETTVWKQRCSHFLSLSSTAKPPMKFSDYVFKLLVIAGAMF